MILEKSRNFPEAPSGPQTEHPWDILQAGLLTYPVSGNAFPTRLSSGQWLWVSAETSGFLRSGNTAMGSSLI